LNVICIKLFISSFDVIANYPITLAKGSEIGKSLDFINY
jgi:hypothetical protein